MKIFEDYPIIETIVCAILLIALTTIDATADEQITSGQMRLADNRIVLQSETGLAYTLPDYSANELQDEIRVHQTQLQTRKQKLEQQIRKGEFSKTDVVIISVVPGGLLYAALKKYQNMSAQKVLTGIKRELAALSEGQHVPVVISKSLTLVSDKAS